MTARVLADGEVVAFIIGIPLCEDSPGKWQQRGKWTRV
jgi:hypothetical protein